MQSPDISRILKAIQKAQHLNQKEMATRMHIEERTYRSWLKGKTSPTTTSLQLLAESFGRTLPELFQVDTATGQFPLQQPVERPSAEDRLIVALISDPEIPQGIKERILKKVREVFRGGGGGIKLL
ncbi:MAG: helix-turn-helix transcriptional regulator [Saprospiraceae bacterium]